MTSAQKREHDFPSPLEGEGTTLKHFTRTGAGEG
jgi:hypothetical protein